MFTGIIEEIGTVASIRKSPDSVCLSLTAKEILSGLHTGDSIAVNGICLTVTSFTSQSFSVDVMHETLLRTSLAALKRGSTVNLERAMIMNGRFGGHIVSGHIDGVGTITGIHRDSIAVWYTIRTTPAIMRYIIEKGSVAIDGISLTVARLTREDFSVSVIPHTITNTTLSSKKVNDLVNLENDCIGKYVAKLISDSQPAEAITKDFLMRYGF